MVSENPNLKVDPPTLDYPHRGESEVVVEDATPATEETRRVEARISSLAVLCMLSALLGFLFFPALAALLLGILALKRIDESDGALTGRLLAITGLCISVAALAAWLGLTALALAAWTALSAVAAWVALAVGWIAWKIQAGIVALF